jgi:hypothetical protein
MNTLRQCTVEGYGRKIPFTEIWEDDIFYFHQWCLEGAMKLHPHDDHKDYPYAKTLGIVEDIKTGKIYQVLPDHITFINTDTP